MVYDISYKSLGFIQKIRFDKVDGFIRVYDGTIHVVLVGPEKYDTIYNRIRYLISKKKVLHMFVFHNYAKIKIDSYDSLHLEKTLNLHNVIILIKLVFDKNQNHYYFL